MTTKSKSAIRTATKLQEEEDIFRLRRKFLASGAATSSGDDGINLINVDDQAEKLVQTISQHLVAGRLTTTMITLLVNHLATMTGPQRWALLGLSKASRRMSASGQETSAIYAFTDALQRGLNEDTALVAAYDAYIAAMPLKPGEPPHSYHLDCKTEKSSSSRYRNLGAQRMATLIRPCLVKANLLPPPTPGRPKNATLTGGTPI